MSAEPPEQKKAALDRRVVDEIIVPLAYFIRERSEPEPREALASRAALFTEIVDRLVAVPDPSSRRRKRSSRFCERASNRPGR